MNTLFVGHNLIVLESIPSTNDFCMKLVLEKQLPEGAVVWAKEQTAGRGQRCKSWKSSLGEGLTFSVLLHPKTDLRYQFSLNKAIAVGLCEGLKNMGVNAEIKWPNDIYVGHHKLLGVLIENNLRGDQLQHSVVGVGINVNQLQFDEALPNPVSLRQLLDKKLDIDVVLADLCYALERYYLHFKAGHFSKINADYHQLLYRKGEQHQFLIDGKSIKGQVEGVDELGKIKLLTADGVAVYAMGEVEFVI